MCKIIKLTKKQIIEGWRHSYKWIGDQFVLKHTTKRIDKNQNIVDSYVDVDFPEKCTWLKYHLDDVEYIGITKDINRN